jgi:hypothetical protein
LAVARREAHLFQKVVADVFNYDRTFLGSTAALVYRMRLELENLAVWYQRPLNFFQLGRPGLAKQAGKLEAVLTEDELLVRAVEG